MPESFAGITVPEGDPGGLRGAAASFDGAAGLLASAASGMGALPGSTGGWQGPASVSFAGSCATQAGDVGRTGQAATDAAVAARQYALRLDDAQDKAKAAIVQAKDAQKRVDQAEKDIDAARSAREAALARAATATATVAATSVVGAPSADAVAEQSEAEGAAHDAGIAEGAARRRLDDAREDLRRAQERGRDAEEAARDAAAAAAGGFGGASDVAMGISPGAAATPAGGPGGPGPAMPWDLTDGRNLRDRGTDALGGAVEGYSHLREKVHHRTGHWRTNPSGTRTWVGGNRQRYPGSTTSGRVDRWGNSWSNGPSTRRWSRVGTGAGFGFGALNVGLATRDQWVDDAGRPMADGERSGRAAMAGAYVGGAAVAGGWAGAQAGAYVGAGIGTFAGGPVGAAIGGAIGAGVGAFVGSGAATAVANHFDGFKDDVVELGGELGQGAADVASKAKEKFDDLTPW